MSRSHHSNTSSLPCKQLFKKYYCCISLKGSVLPPPPPPPCHHTTLSPGMNQGRSPPHTSTCTAYPLRHPGMFPWEGSDQKAEKEGIREGKVHGTRVSKHPSPSCSREALLGTLEVPKSENHKKQHLPLATGRAPSVPSLSATS